MTLMKGFCRLCNIQMTNFFKLNCSKTERVKLFCAHTANASQSFIHFYNYGSHSKNFLIAFFVCFRLLFAFNQFEVTLMFCFYQINTQSKSWVKNTNKCNLFCLFKTQNVNIIFLFQKKVYKIIDYKNILIQ